MKYLVYIFAIVSILFNSCIENDIPYPVVPIDIESISGGGFTTKSIDVTTRVAILTLAEDTDISRVKIDSMKITKGGTTPHSVTGVFDLRTPMHITLSLYQDYDWEIKAEQNIVREFIVSDQIGDSEFDLENKTVKAFVAEGTDLKNLEIKKLKLGPIGITTTLPSMEEITNFEAPVVVDVDYHNISESWTLSVEHTDISILFTKTDVWSKIAWLEAAGRGADVGFRYRVESATEWITIDKENVTVNGGTFSTKIIGLSPQVKYEFIAYADSDVTAAYSATTEPATRLENGGMEIWSRPAKPWLPYDLADGGVQYWDSGNHGSAIVGANNTTPSDDIRPGSSGVKSARLESKWFIVQFAGGSLFVGKYLHTYIPHGVIGLGKPFTQRPTAAKVWVKYKGGKIDRVGRDKPPGVNIVVGETDDACRIYIALGTWTPEEYGVSNGGDVTETFGTTQTPIVVDTRDHATFFKSDAPAVVAYGEFTTSESIDEWRQITIPLDYRTTSVVPTHLVIVCATSKYADYFTGYAGSSMNIDDFELIYD